MTWPPNWSAICELDEEYEYAILTPLERWRRSLREARRTYNVALQVHDEIFVEADDAEAASRVIKIMQSAFAGVPMTSVVTSLLEVR